MRLHRRSIGDLVPGAAPFVAPQMMTFGMGDLVPGASMFVAPQMSTFGMGDLVPNANPFAAPQLSTFDATSGCGCGCGGKSGMGQVDFSLSGTGVTSEIGLTGVPNWLLYLGVAGTALLVYQETRKGKRR